MRRLARVRGLPPLAVLVLVGLALRTGTWWSPNTLLGVMEYDDGVYYAASKLFLHGLLPYRDFTIVHPPLLAVVLLPAAVIGEVFGDPIGMAAARVWVQGVAALNIVLVYRLALRLPAAPHLVRRAALVAAGLYAIMPNAVSAEHTVLLEPFVNLICLAAVLVLLRQDVPTRRAAFVCGAMIAAAIGIKLFAGAYVIAVGVWLLTARQSRLVLSYLGGLAAGFVVLLAPFVAAAPTAAWHDVVLTQLRRPENTDVDQGLTRVASMVGLGYVGAALGVLLLAVVVLRGVVLMRQHPRSSLELWMVLLGLGGVAVVGAPTYFLHYGAFLAPAMVLLVSRLVAWESAPLRVASVAVPVAVPVAVLVGIAFVIGVTSDLLHQRGQADLRTVGAMVPAGSCVYYDAVSLALAADVFQDPSERCPSWVDGRGVALTQNSDWPRGVDFYPEGFLADASWQAANVAQLKRSDFLLVRGDPVSFPEWTESTRGYVLGHFERVWSSGQGSAVRQLWRRTAPG